MYVEKERKALMDKANEVGFQVSFNKQLYKGTVAGYTKKFANVWFRFNDHIVDMEVSWQLVAKIGEGKVKQVTY
jgi:hypothetical protein